MLPLATIAPSFSLLDTVSEKTVSLNQIKGTHGTVVMFICNHCPFVKHVNKEVVKIATHYLKKGIGFIAISSNDVANYPEDSPAMMKLTAELEGYPFPYVFDATQNVAVNYDAACTPDFYLFDGNLKLIYRGQLDDSRPGNAIPVTGNDLRNAINALLIGKEIDQEQKPSMGCNIKWMAPKK